MHTFLPYPSFEETASILDYRRLGKQRVEGFQILKTCFYALQ
jgi:Pyrimidine dimer DNA glycosylase